MLKSQCLTGMTLLWIFKKLCAVLTIVYLRKVQVARDGQELEPTVGEGLLRLWDDLPSYTPRGNANL